MLVNEYKIIMMRLTVFMIGFTILLLAVVPVSAQQVWYLSGNTSGTVYIMYKGVPPTKNANVAILPNDSAIWIADQQAITNVTFPSAIWIVNLVTSGPTGVVNVSIGVWNGSDFKSYGYAILNVKKVTNSTVSVGSFTVPKGQWLALKIENIGVATVRVKAWGGGSYSYLEYTQSNPPYPVPELPTVLSVLIGIALILIKFEK